MPIRTVRRTRCRATTWCSGRLFQRPEGKRNVLIVREVGSKMPADLATTSIFAGRQEGHRADRKDACRLSRCNVRRSVPRRQLVLQSVVLTRPLVFRAPRAQGSRLNITPNKLRPAPARSRARARSFSLSRELSLGVLPLDFSCSMTVAVPAACMPRSRLRLQPLGHRVRRSRLALRSGCRRPGR